jgi:PhnB protein
MRIEPYLFFDGRCEEAIQFYKANLGAEVQMMMRFGDGPKPPQGGGECGNAPADKIMHATLQIGDAVVMASDGRCTGQPKFDGFSLSFSAKNDAEAQKVFNALANGGKINMPLTRTFFSSSFGMVNDKFGVPWMVIVPQER